MRRLSEFFNFINHLKEPKGFTVAEVLLINSLMMKILVPAFFAFLLVVLAAPSLSHGNSFGEHCRGFLNKLRGTKAVTGNQYFHQAIDDRLGEIHEIVGETPLPFGRSEAGDLSVYKKILSDNGANWNDLVELEKARASAEPLNGDMKFKLSQLIGAGTRSLDKFKNNQEHLRVRQLLLQRLKKIVTDDDNKKSKQGKDGKGQGNGSEESKDQNSGDKGRSGGDQTPQNSQKQGNENQENPQQDNPSQGTKPDAKAEDGQEQQPRSFLDEYKDIKEQQEKEKPQQEQKKEEEQEQKKRPKSDYKSFKGVSEVVLRHLYVWELRKLYSTEEMSQGLQNYFNYLQTVKTEFNSEKIEHFIKLSSGMITRIAGLDIRYRSLNELRQELSTGLSLANMDRVYLLASHLYYSLHEIGRYDLLSPQESKTLRSVERLLESLKTNGDQVEHSTAVKFYGELPGPLSQKMMRDTFGADLTRDGTMAQRNFVEKINGKKLWTYRMMSVLRPFLNARHHQLFTTRAQVGYSQDSSFYARGPERVRNTEDLMDYDHFLDYDHPQIMIHNLVQGKQGYGEPAKEVKVPEIHATALHKITRLLGDESTSMDKLRSTFRNLFVAAYIDFNFSELITDYDVIHDTGKEVGSHVIYYSPFNQQVGGAIEISTQNRATQFLKSLNDKHAGNLGGSTEIENALVHELQSIYEAKQKNSNLTYASILLLTDGEQSVVRESVIDDWRNRIGEDVEVIINVVAINDHVELKQIAFSKLKKRRSNNETQEFTYKSITDSGLKDILKEAKSPLALTKLEKTRPVTRSIYETTAIGTAVRKNMSELLVSLNLLDTSQRASFYDDNVIKSLRSVFSLNGALQDSSPKNWKKKTEKILELLIDCMKRLSPTLVPLDIRAHFLSALLRELCEENDFEQRYFNNAIKDPQFRRARIYIYDWLEGKKE